MRALRRSLNLHECCPDAWAALAEAETSAGRLGSAIVAYHRLLRLCPDLADAWFNLARLYQRIGYAQQAADAFGRMLWLSREDRQIRAIIGIAGEWNDVRCAIPSPRTYLLN